MKKRLISRTVQNLRGQRDYSVLSQIYRRYSQYTMIGEDTYIKNLMLAKAMTQVKGCVIECGVWRGGMIAGLADVLGPDRQYFLFDSFQGLPPAQAIDGVAAAAWQADTTAPGYHDNCTASPEQAQEAMRLSRGEKVSVVRGWFDQTLSTAPINEPIALLRLDADWYSSTTSCLSALVPHLAPAGIVIVDDYYTWDGCTQAVNEYFAAAQGTFRIHQFQDDVCFIKRAPAENA